METKIVKIVKDYNIEDAYKVLFEINGMYASSSLKSERQIMKTFNLTAGQFLDLKNKG